MSNGQAVISGVVRDAAGNPVAQARVYFVGGPASFPDIAALTDASGEFALTAPSPGTYQVEAAADGFTPMTDAVTVTAGRPARVEIVLSK